VRVRHIEARRKRHDLIIAATGGSLGVDFLKARLARTRRSLVPPCVPGPVGHPTSVGREEWPADDADRERR